MDPMTREPKAVMVNYLRQEWITLNPELEQDFTALSKLDEGDFDITSRTADDRTWTISYMQDAGPVRYWLWIEMPKKAPICSHIDQTWRSTNC